MSTSNTALAATPGASSAASGQYLSFQCRGVKLALPISEVREIIEYGQVTPVPMMPAYVRGVINLRGNVVPVMDLASRLGHALQSVGRRTCIIILELQQEQASQLLGLVVDAVDEVLDIDADQIEAAPAFGSGIRADFIRGMARQASGFIIILNALRILGSEDLQTLAALSSGSPEAAGED